MAGGGDGLSSPLADGASNEDALAYYKSQYEQLESELADFQASSRELEIELEKDVEAAEKRERQLQEKVESLGFEVEEWKSKYKLSKGEASAAQNSLQKEITTLRDTCRALQLKLRDIEVVNDDFERQARNTTSSLEDLESKYSVAIERGVMLEEEIKSADQDREALRIESQRLRDELSDLKVEAEIRQDKLRHAEAASSRLRKVTTTSGSMASRPQSSISERSSATAESSPTMATPPRQSTPSIASETPTPPSPPVSDKSTLASHVPAVSAIPKSRLSTAGSVTPKPSHLSRAPRHSRGPSLAMAGAYTTPVPNRRLAPARPDTRGSTNLPPSASLTQIRGLIGKMRSLEQRVQSARSKLPAPITSPPRASPRPDLSANEPRIPNTVTVRSARKRTGGSNASMSVSGSYDKTADPSSTSRPSSRISLSLERSANHRPESRTASRMSSGLPPPTPTKDLMNSATNTRPSSRASLSSRQSLTHIGLSSRPSLAASSRPSSRQSITGARTPLGHYEAATTSIAAIAATTNETRVRPRSSIGGSYSAMHAPRQSLSRLSNYQMDEVEDADPEEVLTPTPRRTTDISNAEMPASGTKPPRLSGLDAAAVARRTSTGTTGIMGPPTDRRATKTLSEVGETY